MRVQCCYPTYRTLKITRNEAKITSFSFTLLFCFSHNEFLQTLSFLSPSPCLSASRQTVPLCCLDWYLSKREAALMNCWAFDSVGHRAERSCRSRNGGRCVQAAKAECAPSASGFLGFYLALTRSFPNAYTKEGCEMKFVSNICLGARGRCGVFCLKFRFGSFSACYMRGVLFCSFCTVGFKTATN